MALKRWLTTINDENGMHLRRLRVHGSAMVDEPGSTGWKDIDIYWDVNLQEGTVFRRPLSINRVSDEINAIIARKDPVWRWLVQTQCKKISTGIDILTMILDLQRFCITRWDAELWGDKVWDERCWGETLWDDRLWDEKLWGLQFGEKFCLDVDSYLPLSRLKRTKSGDVTKRQPKIPPQAQSWWKAQCAFRGLCTDGAMADFQSRINGRDRTMDAIVAAQQTELRALRGKDDNLDTMKKTKTRISQSKERYFREHAQWDIAGNWDIYCPELEHYFRSPARLALEIFYNPESIGEEDFWATFNFNLVEGVMRIQPLPSTKGNECIACYRWRGRKRGEETLQLSPAQAPDTLTVGEHGNSLAGAFEVAGIGSFYMTGYKAGSR
jgi:hypothetical protein